MNETESQPGNRGDGGSTAQQPPPGEGAKQPAARPKWSRKAIYALLSLLILGAGLAWLSSRRYESTDDAQVDGYIYPVSARIGGHITGVHVADGQLVQVGTILVEIDANDYQVTAEREKADYQNSVASALAADLNVSVSKTNSTTSVDGAEANFIDAETGVAAAQKLVEEARARVAEAQAVAKKLDTDVKRYSTLIRQREVSQQDYDQILTQAESANAAVAARDAALLAAQEQVRQAEARVRRMRADLSNAKAGPTVVAAAAARAKSAQAQVLASRARLRQAELNLSYTRIAAPIDGIVGRRSAQVGENVEPGQELLEIVPVRNLWITANFKETQLRAMRPLQEAEIEVDACEHVLKGHVSSIGGATGARFSLLPPENATGNFVKVIQRIPVRIDLDNQPDSFCLLRPGMSVQPKVRVR